MITDEVEGDLPFTGSAYIPATQYGNVANNIRRPKVGLPTSPTRNMNMSWYFGERSGRFDITNFESRIRPALTSAVILEHAWSRRPAASISSPARCQRRMRDLSHLRGSVTGSFVRPLSEGMPSGALGNWNIGQIQLQGELAFSPVALFPLPPSETKTVPLRLGLRFTREARFHSRPAHRFQAPPLVRPPAAPNIRPPFPFPLKLPSIS